MRRFGSLQVYVEANFTLLDVEANHPAVREKALGFANCENGLIAQVPQDFRLPGALVTTKKEDVAAGDILGLAEQTDVQYALANEFALQRVLDFVPLRVIVEDADDKGAIPVVVGVRRPIHKLSEVEKKRGLHLGFFDSRLPTDRLRCSQSEKEQAENRAKAGEAAGSPLKQTLRRIVVLSLQLRPPAQKDHAMLA